MPDGRMSNSGVFTSWKEIASYLGKGVRTVQRWEAQFGLPVQRPNAHAKGIVRATKEELDRWIAEHWSARSGQFDVPDAPVGFTPMNVNVSMSRDLRIQSRALMVELQESIEQLARNCKSLTMNLAASRELRETRTLVARGFEAPTRDAMPLVDKQANGR